jgi:hypothetical protein
MQGKKSDKAPTRSVFEDEWAELLLQLFGPDALKGRSYCHTTAVRSCPHLPPELKSKLVKWELLDQQFVNSVGALLDLADGFIARYPYISPDAISRELKELRTIHPRDKRHKASLDSEICNKEWALANWIDVFLDEFWAEYGLLVSAIYVCDNNWKLKFLTNCKVREISECTNATVKDLISSTEYARLTGLKQWSPIGKYALRSRAQSMVPRQFRLHPTKKLWEVKDEHGASAILDDGFELGTVSCDALDQAKIAHALGDFNFILVPPGSRCKQDTNSLSCKASTPQAEKAPPLVISASLQSRLAYTISSNLSQHKCLAASVCSILHILKYSEIAEQLWTSSQQIPVASGLVGKFKKSANSILAEHGLALVRSSKRKGRTKFDPIIHSATDPVVAQLKGELNHCVVFYRGLLVDPAFAMPFPITPANLAKSAGRSGYKGILWSLVLIKNV